MSRVPATLLLAIAALAAHPSLAGDEPRANPASGHDFGEKVLWVRTRSAPSERVFSEGYLDKASIRVVGNSSFLVGVVRQANSGQIEGKPTLWLPLPEVAEMAEFDHLDLVQRSREAIAGPSAPIWAKPGVDGVMTYVTTWRRFRLPFSVAPDSKERIQKFILSRTQDNGKSWQTAGETGPELTMFDVAVPEDGTYGFTVQTIYKNGLKFPEVLEGARAYFKVVVGSQQGTENGKKDASLEALPIEEAPKTEHETPKSTDNGKKDASLEALPIEEAPKTEHETPKGKAANGLIAPIPIDPLGNVRPKTHTMPQRRFRIPFRVNTLDEKDRIEKVILSRSHDEGKTWQSAGETTAENGMFHVTVPEDGVYWFAVQAVEKSGRIYPEVLEGGRPSYIVAVDSQKEADHEKKEPSLEPLPMESGPKTVEEIAKEEIERLRQNLDRVKTPQDGKKVENPEKP